MITKLSRLFRTATSAAPHRPSFEPLEGRRMCSVSPVATTTNLSWGETNTGLLLPAVQAAREAAKTTTTGTSAIDHTGGANTTNIIAVLIGL